MQARIDTAKPHPARVYNYLLGGKDNFAIDRETAEKVMQTWGTVRASARENRACRCRSGGPKAAARTRCAPT